jgi:hypothetical protein
MNVATTRSLVSARNPSQVAEGAGWLAILARQSEFGVIVVRPSRNKSAASVSF